MTATVDPVMAIMGWHSEPLLLQRLKYHVAEAVLEISAIIVCIYLATQQLQPKGLFIRLLCLPLAVITFKLLWALELCWSYWRIKHADLSTAMRRMGCFHTRSHWSCSVAMFTCFSCLLMVWHTIVLLLMFCYDYTSKQAFAVRFLMISSGIFVVANWAFWRDFVRNYRDTQDEDRLDFVGLYKLQLLCKMYKSKVITSEKVADLIKGQGDDALTCTVCLEEFAKDEKVAKLPCGHYFHTACINKWVIEDWRCPFRCPLEVPRDSKKPAQEAWISQAVEINVHGRRSPDVDLEVGDAPPTPETEAR
mmetsp:Transcript_21620/g.40715  ORF Transcript_21620/g.40715 Transcript_21620/m.40715 type:complete len:306 (+) Transcript_21620:47-964(+)